MATMEERLTAGLRAANDFPDIKRAVHGAGSSALLRTIRFDVQHVLEELVLSRLLTEAGQPAEFLSERYCQQLVERLERGATELKDMRHFSDSSDLQVGASFLKGHLDGLMDAIDGAIGKGESMAKKYAGRQSGGATLSA